MTTWRTGRKVGRTIYLQRGREPSDTDHLIGVMDTVELAERVVDSVNATTPATTAAEDSVNEESNKLEQHEQG
jgi:hypothetical protein